jgi:type IV pilus assembly protein PilE
MRVKHSGFTLIELMIVVALIAILASLAMSAYGKYVLRARRVEAKTALNLVMQTQEKYFTSYNKYTADLTGPATDGLALVGSCGGNVGSEGCKYFITAALVNGSNQNVSLTATPQGAQASDVCGPLVLTAAGVKTPAPVVAHTNGACW